MTDWSSFVALPEGQKASYRLDSGNRRLCLGGLRFGTDIPVTLRQGLPAAEGKGLASDVVTVISLGNRKPVVEFGPGLFLPRESGVTVPVTTVNVKQLNLVLYRAGERIISQLYDGLMNEREFNIFDPASLKSSYGEKIWAGRQIVDGPEWRYRSEAGQWVIVSDIGLTSFEGENGMTVVARSFRTAQVLPGVIVKLVARNNEILSQQTSNADGMVRFDAGLMRGEGGNAPVVILASQPEGRDLTLMDLRRSGFDLSDRGVAGRPAATAVDPFLYTDRGIYRPGETVRFVALMRSAEVEALPDRGATLRLYRPNGTAYRDYPLTDETHSGALSQSVVLPKAAVRGVWRMALRSGGATLGDLTIDVQDFVPQLLGLSFGNLPDYVVPKKKVTLPLDVRFLYGAPAAGLNGEVTVQVVVDPTPFPRYKEFHWGKLDGEFESVREDTPLTVTDEQGRTTVPVSLPELNTLDRPVKAVVRVSVNEPGGAPRGMMSLCRCAIRLSRSACVRCRAATLPRARQRLLKL